MKKGYFILMIALLAGCATNTGHQFLAKMSNEEISSKLVPNQTSKKQVQAMFGDPEDIDIDVTNSSGGEVWTYKYLRSEAKGVNYVPLVSSFYSGTNDNIRKLRIKFNANDLVEKFAFSSSKGESKWGMFQ